MSKVQTQLKPINAPIYHYWNALYQSFYSPHLYIDVGKRWKGFGLVYLLLVVAILSIPSSIKAIAVFSTLVNEQLVKPFSQIPPLYVQNGKISIDKPVPYFIKNSKNQVIVIIDTSGKITEFTKEFPNLQVLITSTKVIFNPPAPSLLLTTNTNFTSTPISQKLDPKANGIFDGKKFINEHWVNQLKYFSQLALYPIIIALLYSIALVFFPVLALLAQFASNVFFSFQMNYAKTCRLLIVAATPMLSMLFFFMYFNLAFKGAGFIIFCLLFGYFAFATLSLKKESQRLV